MKRFVILLLLGLLSLNVYACNKDEDEEQQPEDQTPGDQTPVDTLYNVTFEIDSDGEIGPLALSTGTFLDTYVPEKAGYVFRGWYGNADFTDRISEVPAYDVTIYAFLELDTIPDMVRVGELGTTYSVPILTSGGSTHNVTGGYLMATTQTTYELWYVVRVWAEDNGYHFANQGREGSHGATGQAPSTASREPVTMFNWRDAIVWLNALSEMQGLNPVYRDELNNVIRDSRGSNASIVDGAIQTQNNGYRLPTSPEWEMAARWKSDTESTDGSIEVGGRWWTPGNYASGATDDYENADATQLVAWYGANARPSPEEYPKTHPVGQLVPNHLGIYDMSGNVHEWTFTPLKSGERPRILRGGHYNGGSVLLQIGQLASSDPRTEGQIHGFRFVRNP